MYRKLTERENFREVPHAWSLRRQVLEYRVNQKEHVCAVRTGLPRLMESRDR
jgi:hypothetical protein